LHLVSYIKYTKSELFYYRISQPPSYSASSPFYSPTTMDLRCWKQWSLLGQS